MWSTFTTLRSDHLPITIYLSSHSPLSLRRAHCCTKFFKADWEGFTAESSKRRDLLRTHCQSPALLRKKSPCVFSAMLEDTISIVAMSETRYCGPLPDIVWPLIAERDQRHIDDPLDLVIKLLDREIQQHIRHEAQDQWRILLDSSDHSKNPKCYWSLLHKLCGKRLSFSYILNTAYIPKILANIISIKKWQFLFF